MLYHKADIIDFGMHKGETVKEVLKDDPTYLLWILENTDKAAFSLKLQDKIRKRAEAARRLANSERGDWGDLTF